MRSAVLLAALALLATPAASPARSAGNAFTLKLSYTETYEGKGSNTVVGVRGKGTISLAVAGPKTKSVPYAALAKGLPYTTRYDLLAVGGWRGLIVVKLARGSLCASITAKFGKYVSGFPPTTGTFEAVGGTGDGATLRLAGTYHLTDIETVNDVDMLTGKGTLTAAAGAPKALTKVCVAASKS